MSRPIESWISQKEIRITNYALALLWDLRDIWDISDCSLSWPVVVAWQLQFGQMDSLLSAVCCLVSSSSKGLNGTSRRRLAFENKLTPQYRSVKVSGINVALNTLRIPQIPKSLNSPGSTSFDIHQWHQSTRFSPSFHFPSIANPSAQPIAPINWVPSVERRA